MPISIQAPRLFLLALLAASLAGPSCRPFPEIVIDSPAHGVFTTAGSVQVEGHVTGAAPSAVAVAINGTPTPVEPDGSFSTSVALDPVQVFNPILVELTQLGGVLVRERVTVIAGASVAEGTPASASPAALLLRLSDAGLDRLAVQLADQVDFELTTLLPIYTYLTSSSGYDVYVDGAAGGVPDSTLLGVGLEFEAEDGALSARIDLYEPVLRIWMDGDIENCEGYLASGRIGIDAQFALSPDPLDPSFVRVEQQGGLTVDSSGVSLTITDGFFCDIFSSSDQTDDVLEAIGEILNAEDEDGRTYLELEVQEALNDLALASAVGDALGIGLDAEMRELAEDADGITVEARTSISATAGSGPGQCVPPAGAPDLSAAYHVNEALPAYGSTTPGGLPYDVAIGLSTSALNQLLAAEVECGLLTTELTEVSEGVPLTSQLLGVFVSEFASYSPPATPWLVELRPTLAPALTGAAGPSGELAEMKIGHLELRLVSEAGGEVLLVAAIDARFGVDASFNETGLEFQVSAPLPGDISLTVLENPLGINAASFELILPQFLGPLLPSLASSLGTLTLPSFLDMALVGVEASRQGETLTLFVDLESPPSPPLYWRRFGNRLEAYTSAEHLAARGINVPEALHSAQGPSQDAMFFDGTYYWRRWQYELRGFLTPEAAAAAQNPVITYPAQGPSYDAMFFDGTHYWRRWQYELRGFLTPAAAAAAQNPVITHPAQGSSYDAMAHDGTYYWRRRIAGLEAYPTAAAAAAGGNAVIRHPAAGSDHDALMHDGTYYWRRWVYGLEAYSTAEAAASRVNIYASLPASGPATDSMMFDGTHYWRRSGDYVEAYLTPRELALRQHPLTSLYMYGNDPLGTMFRAFDYVWRRYGQELRYYYNVGGSIGLAAGGSPEATYPAAGPSSDSMMYDGTRFWRRVGNQLRGYANANNAAVMTNEVIALPAQGLPSDAMMYAE